MDSIEIRACEGLDELEACVRLQIETWGYDAADVIPRRAFLVAQKIGGQVIGAFEKAGGREEGEGRAGRGSDKGAIGKDGFDKEAIGKEGIDTERIEKEGINKGPIEKEGIYTEGIEKEGIYTEGIEEHGIDTEGIEKEGIRGGTVIGTPESLVGFAFSLPGLKTKERIASPYLHSHMLAVKEACRNQGIGVQLKLAQRREALGRGIRVIEWTFDPLEIKNAFINIHRLGVVVSRYYPNFYGLSSSRLQGGLETDRLVAEWYLDSPRVRSRCEGHPTEEHVIKRRIVVPASINEWKATEATRGRAEAVQLENRRKFLEAFNEGMTVLGFLRDADGNGVFELGPHPGDPSELK